MRTTTKGSEMTEQERYVIVDNGDDTHSVRDTVESRWLELNGEEDMLPHQARSLRTEYALA